MSYPNITIVAPLRQAEGYINGFLGHLDDLDYPKERLHVVLVEGDSTDNTWQLAANWVKGNSYASLIKYDTGRQKYGSVVLTERFTHLADVFNHCIEAADLEWSDYIVFTPSDIIFNNQIIKELASRKCDLIAPMYWQDGQDRFYDIWGFNHAYIGFGGYPHDWYERALPREPVKMETIGGMIMMKADVLRRGARYGKEDVDHGLCKSAQTLGFNVWCDPTTNIYHR